MNNFLKTLEKVYALAFIGVCVSVVTMGVYWLYIQSDIILTNLGDVAVVNNSASNIVEAGKPMVLTRSFCIINNKYPGEVTRTFTNHTVFQLPDTTTFTLDRGLGCHEKNYIVDVPAVLPSDKYTYRVSISYKINPLKTVYYNLAPVELEVVNSVWDNRLKELLKKE